MRASTVARVYAETLLRSAEREDALDPVSESVEAFAGLIDASPRLARFLEAPQIGGDEKRRALGSALEGRLHPLFVRFLGLVIERHRESLLPEIADAWNDRLNERAGRQAATVTTAVPMDDDLRERVREALERTTGKTIALDERVRPELLGGIVIKTGDTVIDGSVKRRLGMLRRRLQSGASRRIEHSGISNEE